MFHAVIPARFASTRLPGKPLADIAGKPMIVRVAERAASSGAGEVWVATDHEGVARAVRDHGHQVTMTRDDHPTGTDRIAEVVVQRGWSDDTIVVNVQGDEPFVPPSLIDQAAALLQRDPCASIATLATPIASLAEFFDLNVVKVVAADDGTALYFSRAPVPWSRDGAPAGLASQAEFRGALRHVGLYAYTVAALARITALPPSSLELCEKLEQLRALQAGLRIVVGICVEAPGPGIDTEHDLRHARERAARAS